MSLTSCKFSSSIQTHWFYLAAAAVVISDLWVPALDAWSNPRLLEAGILFDLSILIPVLYLYCYRRRGKATVIRTVALSCLGIWVSGYLVPAEHHSLLQVAGFVRYIALAALIIIEAKLALMIFRAAFRQGDDAAPSALSAAKAAGMPPWVARLMAWEAGLWRKAWNAVRGLIGRS